MAEREYRKVVTLLFCDVVGSTALGESTDPEALRGLLGRYFDEMKAIVERHGGSVEKFIGDAVMAVFGVPQLHEDDALRAIRAAVEMRDALPELGVEARIGVNTGEVVVGTAERLATGDAVNVAARLEQAAGAGEVLLGPETAALVRDAVETEELVLELKGKSEPLVAHRLISLQAQAPAFARRFDAPLVGRERELRRLQEAFGQAVADRSCQLFTVLGSAGVGKSRLTAEFIGSVDGARVVRGRCLPYGEGITYWPVIEVLKQLPPARELDLDPAALGAIEGLLGDEPSVSATEEIPWALRKLFESAAASAPLVVVFDDIHWAEPAFLDLIEHVADLSRAAPILLLCLARPELLDRQPGWGGGKLNATTVLLEPLSATQTDELLERLLGEATLSEELHERIRDAAEGNPLFVEEMVAFVEASGDGEVTVPGTIQALLAARLDQLEPAERGVLERGSVEGRTFHRGAVEALAPEETQVESTPQRPRAQGACPTRQAAAPRRGRLPLPPPTDPRCGLRRLAEGHARPTCTNASPTGSRSTAQSSSSSTRSSATTSSKRIGTGVELGDDRRSDALGGRAAARLISAGRRSVMVGDVNAAANFFRRALSLREPADREGVEVLLELAFALVPIGDLQEARARYEEAGALAQRLGDRILELRALANLGELRVTLDLSLTAEQALELGHEVVRELEPLGDDRALAAAWKLVALGENLRARWLGVESALEHVLEHARRAGDRIREADAVALLGPSVFWGPTPLPEALPRAEAIHESTRDTKTLASWSVRPIAGFYAMQGRFEEARALLAQARSTMEDLARELEAHVLAFWTGPLEMLAGDPAAAEREYRAACEHLESKGEKGWLSTMASLWAEALYELDRFDEAATAVRMSRDATTSDDYNAQGFWRCAEAKLAARRGAFDEAERLAREAIDFIGRSDELNNQAHVDLGLVEVYRLAGRSEDAIRALDDAIARFEQKGNVVMIERSRALRDELGAAASP